MLEVQLLGHLAVADSGHRIDAVRNPRLLAYLLLNRDRAIEHTEVAFTLWPDSSDAQALTNLRREPTPSGVGYPTPNTCWPSNEGRSDGGRTVRFTWTSRRSKMPSSAQPGVVWASSDQRSPCTAATSCRGSTTTGFQPHRDRLRMKMIETLDELAAGLEDRREYRAAMEQLHRLVAIDPLDEVRYQALMRVAAFVGDRTAGLRAYHACASALRDELGIEPSRRRSMPISGSEHSRCPNSRPRPHPECRSSQSWSAGTRSGRHWSTAGTQLQWSVDARPDRG